MKTESYELHFTNEDLAAIRLARAARARKQSSLLIALLILASVSCLLNLLNMGGEIAQSLLQASSPMGYMSIGQLISILTALGLCAVFCRLNRISDGYGFSAFLQGAAGAMMLLICYLDYVSVEPASPWSGLLSVACAIPMALSGYFELLAHGRSLDGIHDGLACKWRRLAKIYLIGYGCVVLAPIVGFALAVLLREVLARIALIAVPVAMLAALAALTFVEIARLVLLGRSILAMRRYGKQA